jgi:hypothetical protein
LQLLLLNLSATWVCEMEEKTGVSIESRVDCEAKQGKGGNCSPRFAHSNNSATNQGLSELRSVLLVAELPRLRHRHSSRPETMHRPSASLGPEGPEGAPSGTRKTRGRHIRSQIRNCRYRSFLELVCRSRVLKERLTRPLDSTPQRRSAGS